MGSFIKFYLTFIRAIRIIHFPFYLYLLANPISIYTQSIVDYSVTYDFRCISDTTEYSYFPPEEYALLRIESESRFMNTNEFYNDSILADFEESHPRPVFKSQEHANDYLNLFLENVKQKPLRSKYMVKKNFERGIFDSILFLSFRRSYMEEKMDLEWQITNEKDSILGLPCTEAKTFYGGRNYKAWFTREIPINDGPYVFQGLPGLILKVQDSQKWYTFTVTHINTDETERYIRKDFVDQQAVEIDRKVFIEKMKEKKENPRYPAGVLNVSEEQKLRLKQQYEKRFDLLIEKS